MFQQRLPVSVRPAAAIQCSGAAVKALHHRALGHCDADQVAGLDDAIKAHRSRVPDAYRAPSAPGPGSVDGGPRAPGTPRATDLATAVAARLGSRTS